MFGINIKKLFKKEYEYDFFGTVFIISYKFIVSIAVIVMIGIYLLPPADQMDNLENQTYLVVLGAVMVALGLLAEYLFIRVKEGTEDEFIDYIDRF